MPRKQKDVHMTKVFLHHTSGDHPDIGARIIALPSAVETSDGPYGRQEVLSAETDTESFGDAYGKIRIFLTDDRATAAAVVGNSQHPENCQIQKIGETTIVVETGSPLADNENLFEITELRSAVREDLEFSFRMDRQELGIESADLSV